MNHASRQIWNLFRVYSMGVIRLLILDVFMSFLLWKERLAAHPIDAHWLGESVTRVRYWVAHYPERSKIRIHLGRGVIYVWLSWAPDAPQEYPT